MSIDRTVPSFDLNKLTEFNPALVYGFDPEAEVEETNYINKLQHSSGQFKDMFNAYLYAQDVVLAEIKKNGINTITVEKFINFMHELHLRIAATLANDHKETPGRFATNEVFRSHYGRDFMQIAFKHATGQMSSVEFEKEVNGRNKNLKDAKEFVRILKKLNKGNLIDDFIASYRKNKFTQAEMVIIQKIVKLPDSPTLLPLKTQKFVEELLPKIAACNPKDLDAVADLAFFTYNSIVQIHPYFNGNGRLAGTIMNIVLRSLNQPSILIRYPGDNSNVNSDYAKAIEKIDTQPQLLKNVIKSRLQNPQFEDNFLKQLVIEQVRFAEAAQSLRAQSTEEKVNDLVAKTVNKHSLAMQANTMADYQKVADKLEKIVFSLLPEVANKKWTQDQAIKARSICCYYSASKDLMALVKVKNPTALFTNAHTQICAEATILCQGNSEQKSFLQAIENKQYALAFKKAAAVGLDQHMNLLLKHFDALKFNINEPSSNKKTALDWLEEMIAKKPSNVSALEEIKTKIITLGATPGIISNNNNAPISNK